MPDRIPEPAAERTRGPILVTGGTGFIGGRLVQVLRAADLPVRALIRSGSATNSLRELGVELVTGDLRDPDAVHDALIGCRGVIHAGAVVGWVTDRRLYEAVNYEGTRNLLGAARSARLERLVHVSSVVTIGERCGQMATEDTLHRGSFLREYERTKYIAEEKALAAARTGLPVVVVNPTGVIGPGLRGLTGQVLGAYVHQRLPTIPNPENRINLVHVDDVADGILAAYRHGRIGERYILGGDNLSIGEMFRICEELTGIPAPSRSLPLALSWTLALVAEAIAAMTRRPPILTRDLLRVARHGMQADSSKAISELGYAPRSAHAALQATLEWLQSSAN